MLPKFIFATVVICLLGACSTVSYYGQSIQGQLSLLFKREKIDDILKNPEIKPELRLRLQQALSIRQYASARLALPNNKSYQYYVDLQRPYVVWNVFAAPEFSLTPNNWCYPIVGCVSYRGYFKKEDAEQEAEALERENLDVHVGGIAAYSTLGWFNDPLMNTMLRWKQRALAGLIFHELSHQVIYIKNETSFNEAFASSVERLGTIQWILEFHPDQLEDYLNYLQAQSDFRDLLLKTRNELMTLYSQAIDRQEKLGNKKLIIRAMKQKYNKLKLNWPQSIHFDGWFNKPINNARLTSAMTYLQKVPAFLTIFIENNGNWQNFYRSVKALEDLETKKRDHIIEEKMTSKIEYITLVNLLKNNIEKKSSIFIAPT